MPFIGRGSAANSIVSYCLELTEVCPLRNNLYFERFLNPERTSPPDIDLDFSWADREEILKYVYRKYGSERVAMISTTVTMRGRMAVREVAKVFGLSDDEISRFTTRIPSWEASDLMNIEERFPECRGLPVKEEPYSAILQLAGRITNFPRHLSVHPGGIVISPTPLTDFVPLEEASKGLVVTQYDMFPIEDLGLIKIDLLCQKSLGVLKDTVSAAVKNDGRISPLPPFDVVVNDPPTRRLIRCGATMGCFYIESTSNYMLLLAKDMEGLILGVDTMEDILTQTFKLYFEQNNLEDYVKIKPVILFHCIE